MTETAQVPVFDAAQFRRDLAGITQDESDEMWRGDFQLAAANLAMMLAIFYDRKKLEVIKLWERIGTALSTACQEVDDGDLDRLISICLKHVEAAHSAVAASEEGMAIIGELTRREDSWRLAFVRYLQTHSYTVLIHGRQLWEERKEAGKT